MARPPVIGDSIGESFAAGVFGRSSDPAKYLVDPTRFERPRLAVVGGGEFEWPIGTEGVRIRGAAGLAVHKYLGDDAAVVQVTHRDERHIEMSGMFPGITGIINVRDLLEIIVAEAPDEGKLLTLPGIFPKQQMVVVEDYDFSHTEDERTDSWTYTITFARTGVGRRISRNRVVVSPVNPVSSKTTARGTTGRVFVTRAGVRTARQVAQAVYGNSNRWREIYDLNTDVFGVNSIELYQVPTQSLPVGIALHY